MVQFGWLLRSPVRMIGFGTVVVALLLTHVSSVHAVTPASVNSPALHSPLLELPADDTISVCLGDSVCYTVRATDTDTSDKLTLTLLSGPISFQPFSFKSPLEKKICFRPGQAGTFTFIWKVSDRAGSSDIDTVIYTVSINNPPAIEDQYFFAALCLPEGERNLPLVAIDADGDSLTWELLSGAGSINTQTGVLTYTPTGSGANSFLVRVSSSCGFDVAKILDSLIINVPPSLVLSPRDTALCGPGTVCVPFTATDSDSPFSLYVNFGQLRDAADKICFTADTNGTYRIILTATDTCGAIDVDTAFVTVKIAPSNGSLTCPADTAIFLCIRGEICLSKIETSYTNLQTSRGRITNDGTLCFTPDTAGTYVIALIGSDECSADTCQFKVTVGINQPPILSVEEIAARSWCDAGEICVPVTYKVNDADSNVADVSISFGTLVDGQWCFRADSAGTYEATLMVNDSCGESDKKKITVTLIKNKPPVIVLKNLDTTLCVSGPICVPVSITDDGEVTVTTSIGAFNQDRSAICFTPEGSGTYFIVVTATDACGEKVTDTARVDVTLGAGANLVCPGDRIVKLCAARMFTVRPQISPVRAVRPG